MRSALDAVEPVVMKAVENVTFEGCSISSAKGESKPFAWRRSDSWESDR